MAHPRGPFAREAVSTSPSRACYAHNIELPTFSPYQSRGLTTPNTENSDEARSSRRSQTKLDNSPLYDRSEADRTVHCRDTDDHPLRVRAFLNFTIKCCHGRRVEKKEERKNIVRGRNVFPSCSRKIKIKIKKMEDGTVRALDENSWSIFIFGWKGRGGGRMGRKKERERYICINRRANET